MIYYILLSLFISHINALDDGLARTPPMGYRTWNSYHRNVNDTIMRQLVDFMSNDHTLDGELVNLRDLGYQDLGLDDYWQACGKGYLGTFHDKNGIPLVNRDLFPDFKKLTAYGHGKGLKMGWYMNNCICREGMKMSESYIAKHYEQDILATVEYGFDSVKLDNCGIYRDLKLWQQGYAKLGRPIMIENCHWGRDVPTLEDCPYHMFRSSGDISPNWGSVQRNMHSLLPYLKKDNPISRPGCWAYPDMLEVGKLPSITEDRSHFGAWCITSSPLILSFPIELPQEKLSNVLQVVTNKHAIQINQAWHGHPGRRIDSIHPTTKTRGCKGLIEVWAKPTASHSVAVFVINHNPPNCATETLELHSSKIYDDIFGIVPTGTFKYIDVWDKQTKSVTIHDTIKVTLQGRQSAFFELTAMQSKEIPSSRLD